MPRSAGDLLGDLEREAVGVVELEGDVAGHGCRRRELGELGRRAASTPRVSVLPEAALLAVDDAGDAVAGRRASSG